MQNLLVRRIDQSVFCVHCRKVKETQTYTAPGGFGLEIKRDVFLALTIVKIFLIEKFPSLAVFETTSHKHLSGTIYT